MKKTLQIGMRTAALSVALIMLCLALLPDSCAFCEEAGSVAIQQQARHVDRPVTSAPETCTGICSCCSAHWTPQQQVHLLLVRHTGTLSVAAERKRSLAPVSTPFRPPRAA